MIHALRSLAVLVHNPWAQPADFTAPIYRRFRVMPWDCDMNIHLTNGRYPQQLDLARTAFFLRIGSAWLFARLGWRTVLGSQTITFIREIKPLSVVTIESQVLSWDEKYFYMEHRFLVKGKLHAKALARVAVLKGGKVRPFGEMLADIAKLHRLPVTLTDAPDFSAQPEAMIQLLHQMRQAERRHTAQEHLPVKANNSELVSKNLL